MTQQKLVFPQKLKNDNEIYHDETKFPKIRFPEFDEPWKEVKLKDMASFSKGKGISKNDISENGIPCVRYGELYTKYDENITEIYSKTNLERDNLVLSEKNDILIPCSGETAIDLATASCVRDENVAIGGDITIIKTNQYAPFITYCLNNKRTEIAKYAQGVSIVHLYAKDFQDMKLKIPQIAEQKKIVDFLENLNKYIDSLEKQSLNFRKYDNYLKSNIFSEKLKFSNEEWVEVKLKDICNRITRKNKHLKTKRPLTISAQYGLINQEEYFNKIIASENLESYILLNKGEFAYNKSYSSGYPYGAIKRLDNYDKGAVSTLYICFNLQDNVNSDFIKHYFESSLWHKEIYSIAVEGARNHGLLNISVKDFFETRHKLPKIEEQEKIANFMNSIHLKQVNMENKLNNMNNFKNSLLQKMFL